MRASLLVALLLLLTGFSTAGSAQEIGNSRTRIADHVPVDGSASQQNPSTAQVTAADSIKRLAERLRPLQDRLREDLRMRRAESVVGLGIAAYETFGSRRPLPLSFVGTHALRLGLHRELATIRDRSGYVVEPSIGYRSFVLTFRRTLD
jgi:hypothetical protein